MTWVAAAALTAIAVFYTFGYTRVVARAGRVADMGVRRTRLLEVHPRREVDQMTKLALAAAAQATFAVLLVVVVPGLGVRDLFGGATRAAWLLAAPLGLAELGLSVVLCAALVAVVPDPRRLLAGAGGGWVAQFTSARRVLPTWAFVALAASYVAAEEVVFRGIVVELTRPAGMVLSVSLSVALFGWAQVAGMPRRADAAFALVGACVVGTVHGLLFWVTGDVGPLAAAHLVFLLGAFTQLRSPARMPSW